MDEGCINFLLRLEGEWGYYKRPAAAMRIARFISFQTYDAVMLEAYPDRNVSIE